jgi:hypothetical protein
MKAALEQECLIYSVAMSAFKEIILISLILFDLLISASVAV